MVAQDGANCNVFGYNYSREQEWECNGACPDEYGADLLLHGDYPYANLFEGNSIVRIAADSEHGENGPYNTFLRNHTHHEREINVDNSNYSNFVGNSNSNGCDVVSSSNFLDIYTNYYSDGFPWTTFGAMKHGTFAALISMGGPTAIDLLSHSFLNDISYYYCDKPTFLNGYEWPPLGPYTNFDLDEDVDLLPEEWVIPAKDRYYTSNKIYIQFPTEWPPLPLSVSISGPNVLYTFQTGTFTSNPSGGTHIYTYYRWWKKDYTDNQKYLSADFSDSQTRRPPPGYWYEIPGGPDQQSIQTSSSGDFSLKCEVTDSNGDKAVDIHDVMVIDMPESKSSSSLTANKLTQVKQIPKNYGLLNNYPNPFNPETTIKFALPEESFISLNIYSIIGEKVKTLFDGNLPAGYHSIKWDGKNYSNSFVSTGIYIFELKVAGKIFHKKMILTK